jgi:hypothetical protein
VDYPTTSSKVLKTKWNATRCVEHYFDKILAPISGYEPLISAIDGWFKKA